MSGFNFQEAFNIFWPIIMFFLIVAVILILVCHIFYAVGLFTIAKRRELRHSGLAFVPVANLWLFGLAADQYDIITTGRNMKLRHFTLWFGIAFAVCYTVYLVYYLDFLNTLFETFSFGSVVPSASLMILMLIMMLLAIAYAVFYYIALYKIYRSASPENAVVLLVLSIFFSIIIPFVLFAIRKSDKGLVVHQTNVTAAETKQ